MSGHAPRGHDIFDGPLRTCARERIASLELRLAFTDRQHRSEILGGPNQLAPESFQHLQSCRFSAFRPSFLRLVAALVLCTTTVAEAQTLNISDVSVAEGAPGAHIFTFSVTLTAPPGPGGVTFDIGTADGTAQDDNPPAEDNDYVAQSLTGQSLPMGSTGPYQFNVTVNGDNNAEPTETFFVNVTNITGATAGDSQGLGTIQNDDNPTLTIDDVSRSETNGTAFFNFSVHAEHARPR